MRPRLNRFNSDTEDEACSSFPMKSSKGKFPKGKSVEKKSLKGKMTKSLGSVRMKLDDTKDELVRLLALVAYFFHTKLPGMVGSRKQMTKQEKKAYEKRYKELLKNLGPKDPKVCLNSIFSAAEVAPKPSVDLLKTQKKKLTKLEDTKKVPNVYNSHSFEIPEYMRYNGQLYDLDISEEEALEKTERFELLRAAENRIYYEDIIEPRIRAIHGL